MDYPQPLSYLCNVLHATHLPGPLAPTTLGTKTLPTNHSVGLGTYFDAEALPAADKCSLSDIYAAATSPCISHHCTPLCATYHCAKHLCLSHCCSLLAMRCPGIPCTVALSAAPSASVSTQSVSSCYYTSGLP